VIPQQALSTCDIHRQLELLEQFGTWPPSRVENS
jgi:hypothetical protein